MPRTILPLLSVLTGCDMLLPATPAATDEDAKLTTLFKAYLDDFFQQRPLEATRLGDHRFDDRLEDVSPQARAAWAELTRKTLADLPKQVEFAKLSRAGQIDFEILKHHLTYALWLAENTRPFEEDP